jgi:plasmid stability protein
MTLTRRGSEVNARLKKRAERHGRSMKDEIRRILRTKSRVGRLRLSAPALRSGTISRIRTPIIVDTNVLSEQWPNRRHARHADPRTQLLMS